MASDGSVRLTTGLRRGGNLGMSAKSEGSSMDESGMDFTVEELREFLDADRLPVKADPAFKERLRRKLWEFVRFRNDQRVGGDEER
jgi:hypothetical protein